MPYLPPFPATEAHSYLKGGNGVDHDSAALLADGRVLYVWGASGLWYSYYPTARDFMKAKNTLASTAAALSSPSGAYRVTIFRGSEDGASGGLYMSAIGQSLGGSRSVRIYESPSGTGESAPGVPDWTLSSTVWSDAGDFSWALLNFGRISTGRPGFVGSRWILPCAANVAIDDVHSGVYTSENGAAGPWTFRIQVGFYILGGTYGYGQSRQVVRRPTDGHLVTGSTGNVDGSKAMVSTNGGTSWSEAAQWGGNSATNDPIFYADGYVYRIIGNAPAGLYANDFGADIARSTGDIVHGTYEFVMNVDSFIGGGAGFVQQISIPMGTGMSGPRYGLIRNGRILNVGGRSWWIREVGF